jgi:hypothetical protein
MVDAFCYSEHDNWHDHGSMGFKVL